MITNAIKTNKWYKDLIISQGEQSEINNRIWIDNQDEIIIPPIPPIIEYVKMPPGFQLDGLIQPGGNFNINKNWYIQSNTDWIATITFDTHGTAIINFADIIPNSGNGDKSIDILIDAFSLVIGPPPSISYKITVKSLSGLAEYVIESIIFLF